MEIETDADLRVLGAHAHPLDMQACIRACKGKERHLLLTVLAIVVVIIVGSVTGTALNARTGNSGAGGHSAAAESTRLPHSLTFLAIGDWGRAGQSAQVATGDMLAAYADAVQASFVVNVGDSFYDDGVASANDPQWWTSFKSVYTQPGLATRKWYSIAGNHDYRNNVTAQVRWAGDDRWVMPDLNYSMMWEVEPGNAAAGCVAAVFIDTVPFIQHYYDKPDPPNMIANLNASRPAEQLEWAKGALAAARAACNAVIMVGHHPLVSNAQHGNNTDLIVKFGPLLEQYKVDAYLAGHDHTLMHMEALGFDTIITGAGSKLRATNIAEWGGGWGMAWYGDVNGFTVHSVNVSHIQHSFVAVNGTVMHSTLRALRSTAMGA